MSGNVLSPTDLLTAASQIVDKDDERPAWVWTADGTRLLWANTAGLATLGLGNSALSGVEPSAPAKRSLQAVARTPASASGRGRIEILRINAGGRQETLVAICRTVDLGGTSAVLAIGNTSQRRPEPIAKALDPESSAAAQTVEDAASLPKNDAEPVGVDVPAQEPSEASFDLDIAPAHAVQAVDEPPEAAAVESEGQRPTPVVGGAEEQDAFRFVPRSRPHRFSFLVDASGKIDELSSGLADAVGGDSALQDGEVATETMLARVGDLPPSIFHGLDERRRFSEHEVLWPVSGHALFVPVRLSAFDEDDGALRVFGTVLTAKAMNREQVVDANTATTDDGMMPTAAQIPGAGALAAAASVGTADSNKSTDHLASGEHTEDSVATEALADDAAQTADLSASRRAETEPAENAPDVPADQDADYPPDTVDAMKAVAAGVAEGLAGGVTGGVLGDDQAERRVQDAESTDEPIIPPAIADSVSEASNIDEDLSRPEHLTFQEIARRLGARITGDEDDETVDLAASLEASDPQGDESGASIGHTDDRVVSLTTGTTDGDGELLDEQGTSSEATPGEPIGQVLPFGRQGANAERMVLDRLPLGVIIYTDVAILYANRTALDLAGLSGLSAAQALSGIEELFTEGVHDDGALNMLRPDGTTLAVTGRLQSVRWEGQPAALLSIREHTPADPEAQEDSQDATFLAAANDLSAIVPTMTSENTPVDSALPIVRARIGELEAIIDLASDGVVTLDASGEIKGLNQAAQALVGYTTDDLIGQPFRLLFPEDTRQTALDYLDDIASQGRLSLFNEGRELECITSQGGLVPVFMTLGRLTDDEPATYCAVLRDLSPFKQAESDLVEARKAAEEASAHKSDFLARVSHEIRTPLNAVIGFSEVMLEERFGPVGSERYRQYLRDIHTSGEHLMSLLNDLMDLSKIEAGKMDLSFGEVDLNDVVQQCLAIMQPQANQGRIIVRTSLPLTLPKVVADIRSVRQVVLNLVSNAIKFTDAGGQIIISTLYEPSGEISLRVRDTGRGMDAADVELALEPFRQVPTTLNQVITGTGLGLPLTKALVEANRAEFGLDSTPGEGTLAIVTFPSQRVLAE